MKDNCIFLNLYAPAAEAMDPRLTESFGAVRAVAVYTEMAKQVFALARRVPDSEIVICYWRDSKHHDLRWLDADDPGFLVPRESVFIDAFTKSVKWCFEAGAKRVVCLSTLSPGIPDDWVTKAFEMLAERDFVFGPTHNGDWYLIGMNGMKPEMFKDYPWEGEVKSVMLAKRAKNAGLSMHTLPEFYQVNDVKSLEEWVGMTGAVIKFNGRPIDIKKDFPKKEEPAPVSEEKPAA